MTIQPLQWGTYNAKERKIFIYTHVLIKLLSKALADFDFTFNSRKYEHSSFRKTHISPAPIWYYFNINVDFRLTGIEDDHSGEEDDGVEKLVCLYPMLRRMQVKQANCLHVMLKLLHELLESIDDSSDLSADALTPFFSQCTQLRRRRLVICRLNGETNFIDKFYVYGPILELKTEFL